MKREFKDLHLGQEAIGGLSAGIVGTIIGYPLDLVKTRMQTAKTTSSSSSFGGSVPGLKNVGSFTSSPSKSKSSSIVSVASNIVRNEGFLALYKGIGPPLISLSILNTLNFSQYCFFRQEIYNGGDGWDYHNGLAGLSGAPLTATVSTVENLIKTQMQLDNVTALQPRKGKANKYTGSWNCAQSLVQSHGGSLSILYTGHVVNTLREGIFLGTYLYCYEGLRENLMSSLLVPTQVAIPIAGGCSGAIAWFVSFPLDCVRAGVQGQDLTSPSNGSNNNRRQGAWNVFSNIIQQRGIRSLYSGVTPSIVRAFLVSGSRFSAYEGALWLLRGGRNVVHD